jgi:hypothetical protein
LNEQKNVWTTLKVGASNVSVKWWEWTSPVRSPPPLFITVRDEDPRQKARGHEPRAYERPKAFMGSFFSISGDSNAQQGETRRLRNSERRGGYLNK